MSTEVAIVQVKLNDRDRLDTNFINTMTIVAPSHKDRNGNDKPDYMGRMCVFRKCSQLPNRICRERQNRKCNKRSDLSWIDKKFVFRVITETYGMNLKSYQEKIGFGEYKPITAICVDKTFRDILSVQEDDYVYFRKALWYDYFRFDNLYLSLPPAIKIAFVLTFIGSLLGAGLGYLITLF
ncbi:hypothetical protein [Acidiphilium acidophilum]|uniref:hypothetical protein n=1 Tax=Acidiphilium acidophilum TaxID=76588 RepID=UPI002E8E6D95|nr:hypothetical protein [Acidiphilium acidophilum]